MRTSTFLAPLLFAATSLAQAVEEGIAPSSPPPAGCQSTIDGTFEIGTLENPSLRRKRETAQAAINGALSCTLKDGILHDQYDRTGSVVANRQFQFDGPPQAGAIYTGGFSVCKNGSVAIGGSTRWWRCMSGSFGNLYDQWIGAQCHEIRIQAIFPQQASSSDAASVSTVAKSDFSDASKTASPTASGSAATQSGGSAAATSTPARSSGGPSASKSASSSGSTTPAAAPPAQTGTAAAPYHTKGATLGAVLAMIGAALIL